MSSENSGAYLQGLFGLTNKTVIVVGGTGVLCGAMAEAFWKAGANIVLVGRSEEKAEAHRNEWKAPDTEVKFASADAVKREDLERVVAQTIEWFGGIDVWVNGAGVNSATPYLDITEDEFDRIVETNLKATHLGCQVIGAHWLAQKRGGSIINLSSMSAIRPLSRVFTYSLTKAAVWNLTQNLARGMGRGGHPRERAVPGFLPRRAEPQDTGSRPRGVHPERHAHAPLRRKGGTGRGLPAAGLGCRGQFHHRRELCCGWRLCRRIDIGEVNGRTQEAVFPTRGEHRPTGGPAAWRMHRENAPCCRLTAQSRRGRGHAGR